MCNVSDVRTLMSINDARKTMHKVSSQFRPCQYVWKDTKQYQEAGAHYTNIYNAGHRIQQTAKTNGRPF